VIEPGLHAVELLDTWPYLTRLYTTMSPEEITEDPFFHENPDLPGVDQTSLIATQYFPCSGGPEWTLPGGLQVPGTFDQTWPEMPAEMPWAHRIELIPPVGAPQVEVDNSQLIDMLLGQLKVNPGVKKPRDCHGTTGGDPTGDPTGDSTGDSTGGSESSGSAGSDTSSQTDSESGATTTGGLDETTSCACRSDSEAPFGAGLLALVSLGLLRRRR